MEDTAHQSPRGDTAEEPFGHVEPGSGVWREVHMETRMPPKAFRDLGMPAERGVVAADQMQRLASEALAVDLTQQAEPSSALIAPNDGVVPPPRATAGANADHTHCPPHPAKCGAET